MIASMTAFARCVTQGPWGQAIWELRSVNHRHLDLKLKIPDFCREWEMAWRQHLTQHLERGKVDVILQFQASKQSTPTFEPNTDIIQQLLGCAETIGQFPGVKREINAIELLKWPQALSLQETDLSPLEAPFTECLKTATQELMTVRQREGEQLAVVMQTKSKALQAQLDQIIAEQPKAVEAHKAKLQQKLAELTQTVEPDRLAQEWIFYAQKADIEEEIDRLQAHIVELNRLLKSGGLIGRRLDFLMQEMNREVNTMASKSMSDSMTAITIEMKVVIEQMREQIQNLV